jgi:UTP--glucose-1-phosphate uridylyltransferase
MGAIKKAILPVAGLGTRFLPATKSMPKEMLTVIDKPLIQYAVEEAKDAGIEEFIFVTGRGKAALEDFFDYSYELNATLLKRGCKEDFEIVNDVVLDPGRAIYLRQQEPLGLGHAVWCARHWIQDEPFAVLLPDDLILSERGCLRQMMDVYREGSNMVAVMEVPNKDTSKYGIVEIKDTTKRIHSLSGLVEKPASGQAPSNYAIIGRYILQPDIFKYLDEKHSGAGGEIQLTDSMNSLLKNQAFYGLEFEGKRFDCGSKAGLLEASIHYAMVRADMRDTVKDIIQSAMIDFAKK